MGKKGWGTLRHARRERAARDPDWCRIDVAHATGEVAINDRFGMANPAAE